MSEWVSKAVAAFPVSPTEAAVRRIRQLVEKDGREGLFLRIGLKGGGCSGLEYVMRFELEPREGDLATEWDGIVVRCDPKSAKFLEGTTLEYTGNLIGGGFAFDNPNAARKCGCGTSFLPKT
jgi:iron-sulfur cluster assembly protein